MSYRDIIKSLKTTNHETKQNRDKKIFVYNNAFVQQVTKSKNCRSTYRQVGLFATCQTLRLTDETQTSTSQFLGTNKDGFRQVDGEFSNSVEKDFVDTILMDLETA